MRDRSAPLTEARPSPRSTGRRWTACCRQSSRTAASGAVLMLGYMNRGGAATRRLASGFATFFSRSKQRLWRKGETQRQQLARQGDPSRIATMTPCSSSPIRKARPAISARPAASAATAKAPAGLPSSSSDRRASARLGAIRRSYTPACSPKGPARIAQKVGEEGVEARPRRGDRRDARGMRRGSGGPALPSHRADGGEGLRLERRRFGASGKARQVTSCRTYPASTFSFRRRTRKVDPGSSPG